jgi:hypothetical protein
MVITYGQLCVQILKTIKQFNALTIQPLVFQQGFFPIRVSGTQEYARCTLLTCKIFIYFSEIEPIEIDPERLEAARPFRAIWFDPATGHTQPIASLQTNQLNPPNIWQDAVLVLEKNIETR